MYQFTISGFSDEIDPDIQRQFQHLNQLGISYFEPRGINGVNISDLTVQQLADLKKNMADYHIQVSSIGSPIGKITITDNFEQHFEQYKKTVKIAHELAAKYIRMFSFFMPKGEAPETYRDQVMEYLFRFVEYAKKNDIILLHENEKGIYGDTAERCAEIMKNFSCDHFKAVFDPANFVQCGQDTIRAYDLLKDDIVYMHIKDALSDGSIVPAGYGKGNVAYILEQLAKKDYVGFVSLEPHLGSFSGLENLELDDTMLQLEKSDASKFTLAFDALNTILEGIKNHE